MNSDTLWLALAMVLVAEGLFPLLAPSAWRETFTRLLQLRNGQLRFFGLTSISLGVLLLLWLTS